MIRDTAGPGATEYPLSRRLVLVLLALTSAGCQGDDPVDPPFPPPGFGPVAVAVIKPDSATVVNSLGLVTGRRVGDVSIQGNGYRGTMAGFAAVPIKVR